MLIRRTIKNRLFKYFFTVSLSRSEIQDPLPWQGWRKSGPDVITIEQIITISTHCEAKRPLPPDENHYPLNSLWYNNKKKNNRKLNKVEMKLQFVTQPSLLLKLLIESNTALAWKPTKRDNGISWAFYSASRNLITSLHHNSSPAGDVYGWKVFKGSVRLSSAVTWWNGWLRKD